MIEIITATEKDSPIIEDILADTVRWLDSVGQPLWREEQVKWSRLSRDFTASDWEPYLTYYRLSIPEAIHQRGLTPAVLEVLRDDSGSWVGVSAETRYYPNGNISLISTHPFGGKVAVS